MKKKSLHYLQMHTNLESVINELSPDIMGAKSNPVTEAKIPYDLFIETVEQKRIDTLGQIYTPRSLLRFMAYHQQQKSMARDAL